MTAKHVLESLLIALLAAPMMAAQSPPATDVYLAHLEATADSLLITGAANVTRRAGYDNQPSFDPTGSVLFYTSYRDGQADIYAFDLSTGELAQVTRTRESEYSPTVTPDGRRFSVVRVERDSTQRLWTFSLDGTDPRVALADVAPVGYHAWLREDRVAVFVLGSPNALVLADVPSGRRDTVARNIGRALTTAPGSGALTFVQHTDAGESWITMMNADGTTRRLAPLRESEFYAWGPGGTLLTGEGSQILSWNPTAQRWRPVADFAGLGVRGISRLAVSPDGTRIAFVAAQE